VASIACSLFVTRIRAACTFTSGQTALRPEPGFATSNDGPVFACQLAVNLRKFNSDGGEIFDRIEVTAGRVERREEGMPGPSA
jgi:hypothetical protein